MNKFTWAYAGDLPWTALPQDEERFRTILKRTLITLMSIALIVPFLPLPKTERAQLETVPPRLAKLILEQRAQVPPPKPVAKPVPLPETAKPVPERTVPDKTTPAPKAPDQARRESAARQKAARSGLLAMKDDLADLRDNNVTTSIQRGSTKLARGGSNAPQSERALITAPALSANAAKTSGGINTGKFSRDTGGGGLAGRATQQITSPVGGEGGGSGGRGTLQRGGSGKAARSMEEVQLVFDQNKGAIYALYNRALRADPSLQGKVVLRLTIAPTGEVIACQLVSSELKAPELERKLIARVSQFQFGAKSVEVMVVTYPIDFLPS